MYRKFEQGAQLVCQRLGTGFRGIGGQAGAESPGLDGDADIVLLGEDGFQVLVVFVGTLAAEYLGNERVERQGQPVLGAFAGSICYFVGQGGQGQFSEGGAEDSLYLGNGGSLHAAGRHDCCLEA